MKLENIQSQLTRFTGEFPEEAIRAAIDQPELITPVLLTALEETADNPDILIDPDLMLVHYAFYLLAQFREKRAYPLLTRLFSVPGEFVVDATGDFVTEDLGRALASVCDNDLVPIKKMIEDPAVNKYVRSSSLQSIVILVAESKIERVEAITYFSSLFRGKLEMEQHYVWAILVCCCCDLGLNELIPDIEKAFADDLVDPMVIDLKYVKISFNREPEYLHRKDDRKYQLIDNVVDEMSRCVSFKKEENEFSSEVTTDIKPRRAKVGRNEPCPCGSGKKYKRCCLH